jgi:hypothetical protein
MQPISVPSVNRNDRQTRSRSRCHHSLEKSTRRDHASLEPGSSLIQVDIGGHPPSPTVPKHVSGNFGNLLFLVVFRVLNFRGHFEALNDVFLGMFLSQNYM